jgi:hypothetical protein
MSESDGFPAKERLLTVRTNMLRWLAKGSAFDKRRFICMQRVGTPAIANAGFSTAG